MTYEELIAAERAFASEDRFPRATVELALADAALVTDAEVWGDLTDRGLRAAACFSLGEREWQAAVRRATDKGVPPPVRWHDSYRVERERLELLVGGGPRVAT